MTASATLAPAPFETLSFETKQGTKTPWNTTADRKITSSLLLGTDEAGDSKVLEVSTYHNGDRKQFSATARVVKRENPATSPGFSVTTFDVFGGTYLNLPAQPVARYSLKALQAAHAETMATLAWHYGLGSEKVLALFDADSPN